MKRVLTIVGAIAVAAGSIGLSTTADAGIGTPVAPVQIIVNAAGSQKANVAAYTPSFIVDGGPGTISPTCTGGTPSDEGFTAAIEYTCPLPAGSSYEVVVPDPPAPFDVTRFCLPSGDATIDLIIDPTTTIEGGYRCVVGVIAPTIVLDKILPGSETGPLAETDFTLEVFPSAGGEAVGSDTDPSADLCDKLPDVGTRCGYVEVEPGTYVVGEEAEYGYFPLLVECSTDPFGEDDDDPIIIDPPERIDSPDAEVTVTPVTDDVFSYFAGCSIGNIYVESQLDVYKTVTNDDGGTATPDDWTVELFDDEGAMVTSVACAADGTCLSGMFPIGQYTVGEVGPDGYDSTVSRTVTTETFPVEALPDEDATFDLDVLTEVDITIASDDQPTTTTTTTTTTVAPTTTDGPTTTAGLQTTTTAFDAGAGTLPATGSSQRNASMALLAFGFVLFGAAAILTTRRR